MRMGEFSEIERKIAVESADYLLRHIDMYFHKIPHRASFTVLLHRLEAMEARDKVLMEMLKTTALLRTTPVYVVAKGEDSPI